MPSKVLIIEDEKDIVKLLEYNLQREGYQTISALDGEAGLMAFNKAKPDLVVLDLMLPKQSGLEVCRLIRASSPVPILILTAKQEELDRVLGLEMGADDYMVKPFGVREFLARVKALLRRTQPATGPSASGTGRFGALEVSFERYEAKVGGKVIELTSKEFQLLRVLIEGRKKAHTREELLQSVWGSDKGAGLDTRTVDQHVARLRKKLGAEKKRLLTVKNIGYRFKED